MGVAPIRSGDPGHMKVSGDLSRGLWWSDGMAGSGLEAQDAGGERTQRKCKSAGRTRWVFNGVRDLNLFRCCWEESGREGAAQTGVQMSGPQGSGSGVRGLRTSAEGPKRRGGYLCHWNRVGGHRHSAGRWTGFYCLCGGRGGPSTQREGWGQAMNGV